MDTNVVPIAKVDYNDKITTPEHEPWTILIPFVLSAILWGVIFGVWWWL